jgi:retron-type reverse transcriptase
MTSLVHHFSEANLRRAFQELDGSKAPGIDRVTKEQYRKDLDSNVAALAKSIREGRYRPMPSRQVLIPKPQGGTRSLAVGSLQDKIVQTLAARILEAVFEPLFSPRSYGFRPGKTAHQAVGRLSESKKQSPDSSTKVEMEKEKIIETVNHQKHLQ